MSEKWTWNITVKFAFSLAALLAIIAIAVIVVHSKTLRKNKITMLVYYLIIGQTCCMTLKYFFMAIFNVDDDSESIYAITRTILSTPINFFMISNVLLLTIYNHLLRELLVY